MCIIQTAVGLETLARGSQTVKSKKRHHCHDHKDKPEADADLAANF